MAPPRTLKDGICEWCGGTLRVQFRKRLRRGREYEEAWQAQRFCSKGCANQARPRVTWLDKSGYPQITLSDGRQIGVHRAVMEKMLGRKLLPGETVHHKNGKRSDNRPENLELWSSRHGRGQRVEDRIADAKQVLDDYGIALTPPCASELTTGALAFGA